MKYVIKEDKSNVARYFARDAALRTDWVFHLKDAVHFEVLGTALSTLVTFYLSTPNALNRLTIVGVEEVTEPQFKEVIL